MNCTVDGCESLGRTRGYCEKHYARWWRLGTVELPPKPPEGFKKCSKCKEIKTVDSFGSNRSTKDGLAPCCITCRIKQNKIDYWKDPEKSKAKARNYRNKRFYGISSETLEKIKEKQDHRCFLCDKKKRKLVADHDHKTGALRGVVCHPCNSVVIPMAESQPEIFQKVMKYIQDGGKYLENLV